MTDEDSVLTERDGAITRTPETRTTVE